MGGGREGGKEKKKRERPREKGESESVYVFVCLHNDRHVCMYSFIRMRANA